jgi:hypothetical protein
MQNPRRNLALFIIQNKEKFTKIEIQKAQQEIDAEAVTAEFYRN